MTGMRHLAVDGDLAVGDELLHVAARADARLRQHLVQLGRVRLGGQHALGGNRVDAFDDLGVDVEIAGQHAGEGIGHVGAGELDDRARAALRTRRTLATRRARRGGVGGRLRAFFAFLAGLAVLVDALGAHGTVGGRVVGAATAATPATAAARAAAFAFSGSFAFSSAFALRRGALGGFAGTRGRGIAVAGGLGGLRQAVFDGRGTALGANARGAGLAHFGGFRRRGLDGRRRGCRSRLAGNRLHRLGHLAGALARRRRRGGFCVGDRRLDVLGSGLSLHRGLARRARLLDRWRRAFGCIRVCRRVLGRHIRGIGTHCSGPCFR